MIKGLIKAAADLDRAGFYVEADLMDKIMQKVAENLSDDEEETVDEPGDDAQSFGFLSDEDEDSEDEDSEDESEEEDEEDEDSSDHSVEECLSYCGSFSHEEKVELIKALLDSML
jgi:hypothetical protein